MSATPWTPGPWVLTQDQRHMGSDGVTPVAEPVRLNPAEFARVVADRRLIAAAPEMAEALEFLEDAASCLVATFEYIPENYPESGPIHTHEGHTEAYLVEQIKAVRALLSRIRGDAP